ncbi:MAG: DUF4142 domain-containing protein [Acidobacteriota bacterium]
MTIRLFLLACLLSAYSGRFPDHETVPAQDQKFLEAAALGAIVEVRLGELAIQRTGNQVVRDFAKRMVIAYSQGAKEVKELAERKGINCPTELDDKHQQTVERLSELSGPDFDRAYMTEMVEAHERDIKAFENQGATGQDRDIKKWASRTLPKLREHLEVARQTRRQTDMVAE